MNAICIVTLLVLMGSDIVPSKVHAGSSKSSDSRDSSQSSDSKDNEEHHCRQAVPRKEAIENKIKYLNEKHQPLPTCKCGTSGTISKIEIFNANSGKTTTLLTCSDCTSPDVPVTSSKECKNVPDVFHPDLEEFCQIAHPRCKNITVYRCGSLEVSTTEVRTTAPLSTTSFAETPRPVTSTPMQTTTSIPQPPVTTQNNPTVTAKGGTPFFQPDYSGVTY